MINHQFGGAGSGQGLNDLIINEIPSGEINSINNLFVLSNYPQDTNKVMLFRNGLLLEESLNGDYICSGSTIIFVTEAIPQTNDLLTVIYQKQ